MTNTFHSDGRCDWCDPHGYPYCAGCPNESIVGPNAAYLLGNACPTGRHVGSVHAQIAGGRMVLDHPPVYLCGCRSPL